MDIAENGWRKADEETVSSSQRSSTEHFNVFVTTDLVTAVQFLIPSVFRNIF